MVVSHPDEASFLRYIAGTAPEELLVAVAAHLAECATCAERVQVMSDIRGRFDDVWGSWTAQEHGRVSRLWRLARLLLAAAESTPALGRAVERCVRAVGGGTATGVRVLVDRDRLLVTMGSSAMPPDCRFALAPVAAGVGGAEDVEALRTRMTRASELLGERRDQEATAELELLHRSDVRASAGAEAVVMADEDRRAMLTLDGRRGVLSVRVWPQERSAAPESALLVPEGRVADGVVVPFEAVEGEGYVLAEFAGLPTGLFEVIW